MQPGSIVVCEIYQSGQYYVSGTLTKLMPETNPGDIFTVAKIKIAHRPNGIGLIFLELPPEIHPSLKEPCLYNILAYREIQPPMSISLSDPLPEPEHHAEPQHA